MTGAPDDARVSVVGLPAEGWPSLPGATRELLRSAEVVVGSERQLGLLPPEVTGERVPLPTPLRAGLRPLVEGHAGSRIVVLASGDPLWFGIGRTLVEELGPERVHVVPAVSSVATACARLGWPVETTEVVSVVGRPVAAVARVLHDGVRVLVLVGGDRGPAEVVDLLQERGFGASEVVLLEDLGLPGEQVTIVGAEGLPASVSALAILAVTCRADGSQPRLGLVAGLPDAVYEHDGQLTKRHVRALTLSALAPSPGELLWDIGGGSGSIGIEWMRAHPTCRAIAIEPRADRAERLGRNASTLGVPSLEVVVGRAPEVLAGLETPDAVFVGGGLTAPGMLDAVLGLVRPGGRVVVNTVVLESEAVVLAAWSRLGGDIARTEVAQPTPIGGFLGWQPARPILTWSVTKPLAGWPT